jgi:hypothetical protein
MPSLKTQFEEIIKKLLEDLGLSELDPDPKVKRSKIPGVDFQYDGLMRIIRNKDADKRN